MAVTLLEYSAMTAAKEQQLIRKLRTQVHALYSEMIQLEQDCLPEAVNPDHLPGARNLLHYLALRRHDMRSLQHDLAALGISSLGRSESNVLGTIRAVLRLLTRLSGRRRDTSILKDDGNPAQGRIVLEGSTDTLLGPAPGKRKVRIMVTMPSEAATSYELVRSLLAAGMNCMRINCAHDGPEAWSAMIGNLRRAESELGIPCKVEMDLAGPKLRTGPMEAGPAIVKYRPRRDQLGCVTQPAKLWLTEVERPEPPAGPADACLPVPRRWMSHLEVGSTVWFVDARGARRSMTISASAGGSSGFWAEADHTAYIVQGTVLTTKTRLGRPTRGMVGALPAKPQTLLLRPGDTLHLTPATELGRCGSPGGDKGQPAIPARIGVSLPEFFESVKPGEPIWFDDGNIGGVIESVCPGEAVVKITEAPEEGRKLASEKGINIPETRLRVSALTQEDRANLAFAVEHADIIGFSFVRTVKDLRELRSALAELRKERFAIMLKIETKAGFENLPQLLLEAMRGGPVGVMIARGDLAVECGYQRLAELQEEILWIAEAAHVPVVWATQVLESLAKTGMPSRSEITDAAMGERAECVMLNKGRYVVKAVQLLHGILERMQAHQEKKTSKLRKLNVAAAAFGAGLEARTR